MDYLTAIIAMNLSVLEGCFPIASLFWCDFFVYMACRVALCICIASCYCFDLGRIGNQVEHFLGGMAFAAALNRTLVLPPFRTYVCI